mgnify:CR=1 FL=1
MTATTEQTRGAAGPPIHRIGLGDIQAALAAGWDDFLARPTHLVFLFLVYPIMGVVLSYAAFDYAMIPLVFPLIAGFALVAPATAVGLYELSRRREAGEDMPLAAMPGVLRGPSGAAILTVCAALFVLFAVWLVVAQHIAVTAYGTVTAEGLLPFLRNVLATEAGWTMLIVGNLVGFLFAIAALAISVVSLPMLVDGERRATTAVLTSLRALATNPVMMAIWGLVVAAVLALSMLPAFAGLIITLPWLGHATWHLYRRLIPAA